MAYRRKTFKKKRTFKRKYKAFKKRYGGGSKRGTIPYTGNVNVECNSTLRMQMAAGHGGVKIAIPWGSTSDGLTGYDSNQTNDLF